MSDSLCSWGGYPAFPQTAKRCHWRSVIKQVLAHIVAQHGGFLPFGNGRSYGESCLAASAQVLHMRPLNRFIAADWETGLIRVEAGVTLDKLLALVIPKGWFLPVTPGTKFVTLGGALANDVHGKSHHVRGTLACHVPRFGLIRSDRPPLICSLQENPDLYAETIGGLGLTGIIDWLELQLVPIRSSQIDATHVPFDTFDEFSALSPEVDGKYEFTAARIDRPPQGKSAGRSIFMAANHAPDGSLIFNEQFKPNIPIIPTFSTINRLSLRLFNSVYFRVHRAGRHDSRINYEPLFYSLERILNWNRIYGRRGFKQYQSALPLTNSSAATREMLDAIPAVHSGSFFSVLKLFGRVGSPGLLSFPMPGATLALDLPQQGEVTAHLFPRIERLCARLAVASCRVSGTGRG